MLSASRETSKPAVCFLQTRGPDVGMGVEACPHKLGSTNQLRLLLFILIPTISLLAGLLLVLALTGIFGGGVPLPSPKPIADSDPGYHGNSTSPSPSLETENVTNTLRNFSEGNVTAYNVSVSTAATATSYSSSSQATPTQPYTTTPDWLTSVTSLSTAWPISSTAATDSGVCQLIDEPQCNNMLPYNLTWLSSSVAVVKSSEVDMLLRFFGYLSRLSCYRHIMLFGCSLALPECIADTSHNRQIKGKPSLCGVNDHFLCATGICVPQKLVCNGYNDCDDWSDETHCVCSESEFRCNTGRCISPELLDWLCDGDHDCLDKSDEVNCCELKSNGLMECRNGACIPSGFRCDGEDDCKDGSDEEHCSKENQGVCPPGQPSCISTSSCDPQNNNNNSNCTRCEAISLELCMNLPYNQTIFPNFLGHLSQRESSVSWESSLFPALVQTGCHPFLMFYACTLLVPKCDPVTLQRVPPCRSLCRGAKEKCESVLGIVGLQWPEDSDCSQFPEEGGDVSCLLPEDGVDGAD
ncbi:Atrial natriuretic peptide-converting enzyme [Dissostichus eleginoides]|uniref:Atrial natriuretic peptide-converting enzyme n=1 Tax=Dissostichus eleginoides TaxID=100907 RepID=A0AAD9BTM8_DISEL|nr:Atrial natriuretic peptide-converting enzyme [Dissostichus eleginoides]